MQKIEFELKKGFIVSSTAEGYETKEIDYFKVPRNPGLFSMFKDETVYYKYSEMVSPHPWNLLFSQKLFTSIEAAEKHIADMNKQLEQDRLIEERISKIEEFIKK